MDNKAKVIEAELMARAQALGLSHSRRGEPSWSYGMRRLVCAQDLSEACWWAADEARQQDDEYREQTAREFEAIANDALAYLPLTRE